MSKLTNTPNLTLLWTLAMFSSAALSHSGGLDSNGCHGGSKPYHCHRAPSEMVGNRLRCDLGSQSKECINTRTKAGTIAPVVEPVEPPPPRQSEAVNRDATKFSDWTTELFTPTGQIIKLKKLRCENGNWMFDAVNNEDKTIELKWIIWIEDSDGDAVRSEIGKAYVFERSRKTVDTSFSCGTDFDRLSMSFELEVAFDY